MAAHRYWRVRVLSTVGNVNWSVWRELQMRTSVGGSNVCTGGTPIGTQGNANGTSENPPSAFDGVASTFWQGVLHSADSTRAMAWCGYDFGSGNDKDIVEVAIDAHPSFLARNARMFVVESSDDGVNWTFEWLSTPRTWPSAGLRSFAKPAVQTHNRYWTVVFPPVSQLNVAANTEKAVAELDFFDSGSNVTSGGTALGDTQNSTNAPANAFDNSSSTFFMALDNHYRAWSWLGYDFGSGTTRDISRVDIQAHPSQTGRFPRHGIVCYSQDGLNWLPSWSYVDPVDPAVGATKSYTESAAPTGRYMWRVQPTGLNQSGATPISFSEVEFRETPGGGAAESIAGTDGIARWESQFSTSYPGTKAFDGVEYTGGTNCWLSDTYTPVVTVPTTHNYIAFIFDEEKFIEELTLIARGPSAFVESPTTFDVQYSEDHGFNWITTDSHTCTTWSNGNHEQVFSVNGGIIVDKPRRWRANVN